VRRTAAGLCALASSLSLASCGFVTEDSRAVFVLIDVSGTYFAELDDAVRGSKLVAASLDAGDHLTVSEIGSCSFDDDAIVVDAAIPDRPSEAAAEKTAILARLDAYPERAARTQFTDIHGALLQAVDRLSRSEASERVVVVFSDLVEDPVSGCGSASAPLDLTGVTVIAANVIKLNADAQNPQAYFDRIDAWEEKVETAGGRFVLVDDVAALREAVAGA
jgi:hypothetical protein